MSAADGGLTPSRTSSRKLWSTTVRPSWLPPPLATGIDAPEFGLPSGVTRGEEAAAAVGAGGVVGEAAPLRRPGQRGGLVGRGLARRAVGLGDAGRADQPGDLRRHGGRRVAAVLLPALLRRV